MFCSIILNPRTIIAIHNNPANINKSSNWCDSDDIQNNNNNNNKTNTIGQR